MISIFYQTKLAGQGQNKGFDLSSKQYTRLYFAPSNFVEDAFQKDESVFFFQNTPFHCISKFFELQFLLIFSPKNLKVVEKHF